MAVVSRSRRRARVFVFATFLGVSVLTPSLLGQSLAGAKSSGVSHDGILGAKYDSGRVPIRIFPISALHLEKTNSKSSRSLPTPVSSRGRLTSHSNAPLPGQVEPIPYGGGGVMGTTSAGITLHPIFWAPTGYSFPSGYESTLDQFLSDVVAGSQTSNNVLSVITQYYQTTNGTKQYINDIYHLAPDITDTDAYPSDSSSCTPDSNSGDTACVSEKDEQSELSQLTTSDSLPTGNSDLYLLFYPPNVESCSTSTNASQGGSCAIVPSGSNTGYCGDHTATQYNPIGAIVYSDLPFPYGGIAGCDVNNDTTGTGWADEEISTLTHEIVEAATDPEVSAWGSNGLQNEVADLCLTYTDNEQFGPDTWSDIEVFSNQDYATDPSGGCVSTNSSTSSTTSTTNPSTTTTSSTSTTNPSTTTTSTTQVPSSSSTSSTNPIQSPSSPGYWMLSSDGTVYPFGSAGTYSGTPINYAVSIAPTPTGLGYWVLNQFGQVSAYGDAYVSGTGATQLAPNGTAVSIASTKDGEGYWIVTYNGRIITVGDATNYGSPAQSGTVLAAGIVDLVATPDGKGYWLLGGDGGVFAYGDAGFFGSTGGTTLNAPAIAMTPTSDGKGYWFVATDGGVFAYGDAMFKGSMGGKPLAEPVDGIVKTSDGLGYWMVASDGGVFAFGDAQFVGSLGANPPSSPIVGFAPD